jgi:hypothetical protein
MRLALRRTLLVAGLILALVVLPIVVGGGLDTLREVVRTDQTAPTFGEP